jgi:hypothetical protein
MGQIAKSVLFWISMLKMVHFFWNLQNQSPYLNLKKSAGPIPFGALNGVK